MQSHPAGVRGLKPTVQSATKRTTKVAPRRGAWIETPRLLLFAELPPASHPAGVRGLKLGQAEGYDLEDPVAPRRGAWIETPGSKAAFSTPRSRTPQGCVD